MRRASWSNSAYSDYVSAETRSPLKVLQFCEDTTTMSATKKSSGSVTRLNSRQFLPNRYARSASTDSSSKTASMQKHNGVSATTGERKTPLPNSCDKMSSSTSKSSPACKRKSLVIERTGSAANMYESTRTKKGLDATNSPDSRVHSLMSSPKWARIKDKFESTDVTVKPDTLRSISETTSCTTIAKNSPFSKKTGSYLTNRNLPTKPLCNGTNSRSLGFSEEKPKTLSGTTSQLRGSIKSTQENVQSSSQQPPAVSKSTLDCSKANIRNVPLSARAAASSLLPSSGRLNYTSKKLVHSDKNSSSSAPSSAISNGTSPSLSSLPSSSSLKAEKKLSDYNNSEKSIDKQSVNESANTYKLATTSSSIKDVDIIVKKTECEKLPGTASITKSNMRLDLKTDHSKPKSKTQDRKNLGTSVEKESQVKSVQAGNKNLWVKDKFGNWVKNADSPPKNSTNQSKISVSKNKFRDSSGATGSDSSDKLEMVSMIKSGLELSNKNLKSTACKDASKINTNSTASHLLSKVSNAEINSESSQVGRRFPSRSSLSRSSSSSNDGSEKSSSSGLDDDPQEKARKLSLVQRAVLSYEENLSLLSPETQRKLKLLGEKVRAQAENDQCFITCSSLKSSEAKLNEPPKATNNNISSSSSNSDSRLKSITHSNQLGDKVPPVRSFLSRYNSDHLRKGRYLSNRNKTDAKNESEPEPASKDLTSSDHYLSDTSEMTSSESTLTDSVSSISVKALTQRFRAQDNESSSFDSKSSNLLKINNLQKDSDKLLRPNHSFLWRNVRNDPKNVVSSEENDDKGKYHKYYVLENYYTPLDYESTSQKSEENNREYASGNLKVAGGETCYQNISSSDSSTPGKQEEGDEEGWTDMSEDGHEVQSKSSSSRSSTLKKRKNSNKSHSHHKSSMQRTCSQNFKNISKTDVRENCCQSSPAKDKINHNEPLINSEEPDDEHLYEPVYESLNNYMVTNNNEQNDVQSLSPDDGLEKDTFSSYTSLESLHSEKVESNQDLTEKNLLKSVDNKKMGSKMRRLRRHLSWTKSDIKLELSSKFNKIKIKKNSPNSTEIGLKMQDNNSASTSPKKNTFIKCILKQKSASEIPVKKSLSPKKESAHFYVHLSMTSEKPRPFSDSCMQDPTVSEIKSSEFRKTFEPSLGSSGGNHATFVGGKAQKRSSGQIIRPTAPPPLPPTQAVAKKNGCEMKENQSSLHKIVSRNNSLSLENKPIFSGFNTNSSHYSESLLDGKGEDNQPTYSDIETGSIYATIDSLNRRKRNSIGSSASYESYAVDESGSSGASSSTTYSSGFTLHIESDFNPYPERRATSRQSSDLSLPLVKEYNSELLKSPFEEEPLYQFYHKNAQERATMWYLTSGSESECEDILEEKSICELDISERKPLTMQSQTSAMELIRKEGGQRTLWCEVPEVRASFILDTISPQERKLQEAMFEVITSEASYLKSLNFLLDNFVQCPEFCADENNRHILDKRERHILFSDVPPVRDVSASLLSDLEKRWLQNIVISDVCDIVYNHASKYFSVYVKYCSNQIYQDRTLKQLKETRPAFVEVLKRLETNPVCQGLDMLSFLMLPMQRITRLPLLIDAIFHRLQPESPIYESCKMALGLLNKLVAECNEGARKMERMEEMLLISHQLDFKDCKGLGVLSASRWLVKKGELVQLVSDSNSKRSFGRNARWCKIRLFLFLFTDLLVITKKKSDESYCVVDYCPRNMVQVMLIDENTPLTLPSRIPSSCKNTFQLTMLNNKEGKTVEMLLSCVLESDRTRWMNAVTPPISQNPDEKIYEEWDCPQVQCTHVYVAQQPDELSIEEADVVNVFRKMSDGWYEGERIRDGLRGWFPSSHTVEIVSSHVRARNLRQRYRLLMLSQSYLEEQLKAMALQTKK